MPRKYKYETKDTSNIIVDEGYIHGNLDVEIIKAQAVIPPGVSSEWNRLIEFLFRWMEKDGLKSLEVKKL